MTQVRPTRRLIAGLVITAVAALASVALAPQLPARLVTHWSASGTPDDTMAKATVLLGAPAFVLGIVLLFEVIPRIDPLADNIREFQSTYDALAVTVAGFLAYTYGVLLAWNLGYAVPVLTALAPAIAVLYVAVGFMLERAQRNWFVGIRTPWTLSSDRVWRRTHDAAATWFKLTGVLALGAVVSPSRADLFLIAPAVAVSVGATVYSFVAYRRLDDESGAPE